MKRGRNNVITMFNAPNVWSDIVKFKNVPFKLKQELVELTGIDGFRFYIRFVNPPWADTYAEVYGTAIDDKYKNLTYKNIGNGWKECRFREIKFIGQEVKSGIAVRAGTIG